MKRQHVFAAVLVASLGVVAASQRAVPAYRALPYYSDVTLTPHWAADATELAHAPVVGSFSFTDQHARRVTEHDVAGRVYIAAFFYSECRTLCPDVRSQLARVHDAFSADSGVVILSHTVLPERDDVTRLAHYAHLNGIDGELWRLLTGSRAELERLARERYWVELSDTTGSTRGTLRHTETLVLVDGEGHVRGVYDGSLAFEASQLIADVRVLRKAQS